MSVFIRLQCEQNAATTTAKGAYEWHKAQYVRRVDSGHVVVQLPDGTLVEVDEQHDMLPANEEEEEDEEEEETVQQVHEKRPHRVGSDQIDRLCHLNEPVLVEFLRKRFARRLVYCQSGAVLVAVNPFQQMDALYSIVDFRARHTGRNHHNQMPAHVFSIAEQAYRALRNPPNPDLCNQTVLVSGESGAGKTENTKFIMKYLAAISSNLHTQGLEAQVLNANPILESFGNARTLRNDNSSRFGKFVRIFFNTITGEMVRTSTDTYLLEKVRVVHHFQGERNFHVFYELLGGVLASTPANARHSKDRKARVASWKADELLLQGLSACTFRYTNAGGSTSRQDGVEDADQFRRTVEAMQVVGFTPQEQRAVWCIVSSILHLGNIEFEQPNARDSMDFVADNQFDNDSRSSLTSQFDEDNSPCQVIESTQKHVECCATLLAVSTSQLVEALTSRTLFAGGESFPVYLPLQQCADARDTMAKTLYAKLFEWLVFRINQSSNADQEHPVDAKAHEAFIGVLDIFGFEEFERNAFEQFCINYANEKLQCQFLDRIMKREQVIYQQEGLKWTFVSYQDNAGCVELVEGHVNGIWSLLDEECMMPKGNDTNFARKLYKQFEHHSHFRATRKDQAESAFVIVHYAKPVRYHAAGFCDKSRDLPNDKAMELLRQHSTNDLVQGIALYKKRSAQGNGLRRKRRTSHIAAIGVGSQFKLQLASLLEIVEKTNTSYIRCIKPNDARRSDLFDDKRVANQLRFGGVLNALEIIRRSFPVRMAHEDFASRYPMVLAASNAGISAKVIVSKVLAVRMHHTASKTHQPQEDQETQLVFVGKTRVFLRQQAFEALETLREQYVEQRVVLLQSVWRQWRLRQWFERFRQGVLTVQHHWRKFLAAKRELERRAEAVYRIESWYLVVLESRQQQCRNKAARRIQQWLRTNSLIQKRQQQRRQQALPQNCPELPPLSMTKEEADGFFHSEVNGLSRLVGSERGMWNKALLEELQKERERAERAEATIAKLLQENARAKGANAGTPVGDQKPQPKPKHRRRLSACFDPLGRLLHEAIEDQEPEEVLHVMLQIVEDEDADKALIKTHMNAVETFKSWTPLHLAISTANLDIITLFFRPDVLPFVDLNCRDVEGNTPLHLCVLLPSEIGEKVMEFLLSFGANPSICNYFQRSPLHLCCMSHGHTAMLQRLLAESVCLVNQQDVLKRTALHYCAEREYLQPAILLMQNGADMNVADLQNNRVVTTPLAMQLLEFISVTPITLNAAAISNCMICTEAFGYFGKKLTCRRCRRVCCRHCCRIYSMWHHTYCFDCAQYVYTSN